MIRYITTSIFLHAAVFLMMSDVSLGANYSNYPATPDVPKPCTRLKNTVTFLGEICTWNSTCKKYTEKSESTCVNSFIDECPEFNEAKCEEYKGRHCCKMSFRAEGKDKEVWMEVFYANQYGHNDTNEFVGDIVEIHRNILKPQYFGNRSQPDYPDNVLDPKGERGLKWVNVDNPEPMKFSSKNMCPPAGDSGFGTAYRECWCADFDEERPFTALSYLQNSYTNGFNESKNPPTSAKEKGTGAKVLISFVPSCVDVLVDGKKRQACRVLYRRGAYPHEPSKNFSRFAVEFVYLEAQFYELEGATTLDRPTKKLRYAYWNQEAADVREQIFTDKNIQPGVYEALQEAHDARPDMALQNHFTNESPMP